MCIRDQHWCRDPRSNVSDNSTHGVDPVSGVRAKRVQRYSRAPYELERFAARRRLSYDSHGWFRAGWSDVNPAVRPGQTQSVLCISRRARKGGAEGVVHRVEARVRPVELILDDG